MLINLITMDIFLPECHSLKEKRKRVKSIIASSQEKFHISIREDGFQDKWQRTQIIAASLVHNQDEANKLVSYFEDYAESAGGFEILSLQSIFWDTRELQMDENL